MALQEGSENIVQSKPTDRLETHQYSPTSHGLARKTPRMDDWTDLNSLDSLKRVLAHAVNHFSMHKVHLVQSMNDHIVSNRNERKIKSISKKLL